jgi:hypothetical protein
MAAVHVRVHSTWMILIIMMIMLSAAQDLVQVQAFTDRTTGTGTTLCSIIG